MAYRLSFVNASFMKSIKTINEALRCSVGQFQQCKHCREGLFQTINVTSLNRKLGSNEQQHTIIQFLHLKGSIDVSDFKGIDNNKMS